MRAGVSLESIVPDRSSPVALQQQLYQKLRGLIEARVLPHGTLLPSTRALAQDLGIGRNTVIAAYDQLELEGFLLLRPGAPPRVRELPDIAPPGPHSGGQPSPRLSERGAILSSQPFHHCEPGVTAFHPGLPDPDEFPFNTWARLLTRRAKLARSDLFGTYFITGYPDLREAIARYLTASRGVVCDPDQVVVTNGAQSAFDLLARLLLDPGDTVWMEEPGYYGAASAFVAAGARLAPLYVDDSGWRLDPPPEPPRAIFVTPSCHHPLGLTMSMGQRLDLIRLSERWGSWIVEDDYDSEYRFQGQPIPALQGVTGGDRTIFVGTFAKILFPAMRLGYVVVPKPLLAPVKAALSTTGQFAPLLTQAALADFLGEGHLTRHLRRMRRLYAQRRETFMPAFEAALGEHLRLRRTDTGIQLVATFRRPVDDRRFAAAAGEAGVNVSPFSLQFRHGGGVPGLVLGFAAAGDKALRRGLVRLAEVAALHPGKDQATDGR
jgi:GntR family transcriptional regulator/MocR family aminotransferase